MAHEDDAVSSLNALDSVKRLLSELWRDDTFFMVIDGPIAAGKSTLMRFLEDLNQGSSDVRFEREPLGEWTEALEKLVESMNRGIECKELLENFQTCVLDHHKRVATGLQGGIVIAERGLRSVEVFARVLCARGLISHDFWQSLSGQISDVERTPSCRPALTIVVSCSVDRACERIATRAKREPGRKFETRYDKDYLKSLHEEYKQEYPLESNSVMFVDGSNTIQDMLDEVTRKLQQREIHASRQSTLVRLFELGPHSTRQSVV